MFPGKSGMKSACNGGSRRCCHDRRVLVIPLLPLMGMFSSAKIIAAMKTVFVFVSVCGRRQDYREQERICSVQSSLPDRRRPVPVKRCINTEMTDGRGERHGCSRRAGRATCRIVNRQHLAHATVSKVIQEELTCRNRTFTSSTSLRKSK